MDKELVRSHVQEIKVLHQEVRGAIKMTVDKVIRIGELLTQCKEEYGTHGLWMAWLESNKESLGFGYVTANNYIHAYERRNDPQIYTGVNLKDIYYPQLEHKKPVKAEPKEQEPEPLPARLQPPVAPKVEEPEEVPEEVPETKKDDEWLDEPLTDEQDDWVEEIENLYVKLDDDHKELIIDWILAYREAA
jgi:hypothetical protein